MRTGFIPLVASLAIAAPTAVAHAQRMAPITGEKLLSLCGNARMRTACDAYVSGVGDGIAGVQHMMSDQQGRAFAGSTCIPDGTSGETLRSTVIDYLHTHSDLMGKPAAVSTFEALHAAFPCRSNG